MDNVGIEEYVATFVKDLVQNHAASEKMLRSIEAGKPYITTEFLSVAMIDISGYSRLFSRLAELGKVSSEIVTESVCKYMDQIISVIYKYDGDIVKFLGDAVLVTFSKSDDFESEESSATRALACCLEILAEFGSYYIANDAILSSLGNSSEYKTLQHTIEINANAKGTSSTNHDLNRLRLHGALTCGRVDRIIMGSEDRLDYSIDSSCLKGLGSALDDAGEGELGLSKDIAKLLRHHAIPLTNKSKSVVNRSDIQKIRSSDLISSVSSASFNSSTFKMVSKVDQAYLPILCKFLNKSLLKKLLSVKTRHMSQKSHSFHGSRREQARQRTVDEYRDVSIVFTKLDVDSAEKIERIQKTLTTFLKGLEEESGVFQQYSVDDKGHSMLAVFGLPPWPDKSTAVSATKTMIQFLYRKEPNVKAKISITSGQILFSEIGNELRKDASLLGDIVNIAARMVSLEGFEDCILCDEATKYGVMLETTTEFTDCGEFMFKGKSNLTKVWKLDIESTIKQDDSRVKRDQFDVIGYENERKILQDSLDAFLSSSSPHSTILIQAPSAYRKNQGSASIHFDRNNSNSDVSHGKENNTDEHFARQFLEKYREPTKFVPFLKLILPSLHVSDTPWFENLDSKSKSSLLKAIFIRIFNLWILENKSVIVFDDAQWLDPASLEILHEMIEICPQIMVLMCSRPISDAGPEALQKIAKSTRSTKVMLEGFKISDVNEFMVTKMRSYDVLNIDEDVLKGVAFEVDGSGTLFAKNNIKIESVLLSGIDAGVKSQFDRLDPAFQSVLRVAAAFGQYFALEDVLFVSDADGTIEDLVRLIGASDTYKYLTVLPYETIYDGLPFSRRVELHTIIAEMFENIATRENRRIELLPLMGYHYSRSDRIDKKIYLLEELAIFHLGSCDYATCQKSLQDLIAFVEEHRDLISKSLPLAICNDILCPTRKALWYSIVSESFVFRMALKPARANALTALSVLGLPNIDDPAKVTRALKRAVIRQAGLLFVTQRGRKLLRKERRNKAGDLVVDPKQPTLDERVRYHAFNSLVMVAIYDDTVSPSMTACAIFEMANAIIPTAAARPAEWARLCARAVMAFYINSRTFGMIYLKTLNELLEQIGDQLDAFRHSYASIQMYQANFEGAVASCRMYTNFHILSGDKIQAFAGACFTAEASYLNGEIEAGYEVALPYLEIGPKLNPYWCALIPKICGVYNAYKGNLDEAMRYIEMSGEYAKMGSNVSSIRELPNAFKCILQIFRDDPAEGFIENLNRVSEAMRGYRKPLIGVLCAILDAAFACCFTFMELKGKSKFSRFSDEQKKRFIQAFDGLEEVTHFYGVSSSVGFMFVGFQLMQLSKELALKNGNANRLRWWKKLNRSLEKTPNTKKFLDGMYPLRSNFLLVLGAFGASNEVRKHYLEECIWFLRKIGADGIAGIITSSPMYKSTL
ncbi:hypothetical protein HDU97_002234 [Phlyctochytrium planicorne]|nr:hypothetical protein HDU97_002234 [Phlyctochytrium planicorne]